jgi:hypothetical protein
VADEVVHGYCTVDDLREQLGDLTSQNLSERQLVRAINSASRAIDKVTDRRFWADETPVTKIFPVHTCDGELWLREDIAHSTGLEIVTFDGTAYTTVWDAADYRLWPYGANTSGSMYGGWWKLESARGLRFDVANTYSPTGYSPIQITARFGWSFCPSEIESAALLIAAKLFKRKDAPYGVAQFGDIAAVQITRTDKDVQELIWAYLRDVAMVA